MPQSIKHSISDIFNKYKKWIIENPVKANDYEVTAKWVSYLVVGHFNDTHVASELVYCLSNLLVLFNDTIINNQRRQLTGKNSSSLKLYLTVLEYMEVILELTSYKLWGNYGKWLVLFCIHTIKCISRLLLIYNYKETNTQNPPVQVLLRSQISYESGGNHEPLPNVNATSYQLRHSKKVIRRVDASPPLSNRTWKPIQRKEYVENKETVLESAIFHKLAIAETIYVVKPLLHLTSMRFCGNLSWKPYLLSLTLDLASLCLKGNDGFSPRERQEVAQRYVNLLFYLLRSPFYDSYSRQKISNLLSFLSANIPLIGLLCNPLNRYIPFWQSNYSYTWSV